jgi:hypothetical protein
LVENVFQKRSKSSIFTVDRIMGVGPPLDVVDRVVPP